MWYAYILKKIFQIFVTLQKYPSNVYSERQQRTENLHGAVSGNHGSFNNNNNNKMEETR